MKKIKYVKKRKIKNVNTIKILFSKFIFFGA